MKLHAKRKPKPSIANYNWYNLDGCWFCKNRNNCGSCKTMKQIRAKEVEKQNRKDLAKIADEIAYGADD